MNLTEKKTALSLIDERAALFEGIADRIWENPELSLKEFQARDLYCRALRELGFSVTENLCGIGTAFCGSYGSGRPVIGILGEFESLTPSPVSARRPVPFPRSPSPRAAAATAAATTCWGPARSLLRPRSRPGWKKPAARAPSSITAAPGKRGARERPLWHGKVSGSSWTLP